MSLQEQLTQDMKSALKNKEKTKLSVIRMLRSSIKKAEIDKRSTLGDDEVLDVIVKEVKQRRDSIREFEKAGRDDLVLNEQEEMKVLESYLPEQLSEEELRLIIQSAVSEVGATSRADLGKLMPVIMPQVKGKADGKKVNQIVMEFLS
ncbi:GatB/YqeY domain-containing protein [Hazenella sp. IB182357]|uniref:GatB/YqeY domain-containing protein n=1 Tax=Polycladospora coralii TaxID=2771432 RepID=A0A926RTC2_9BACL|nr:GatB/YqeY domain-containing protein [Polycladospora coralii]MBS7530104.1 GatB/YqeY domain-containing protein [Polycladospora coralii]